MPEETLNECFENQQCLNMSGAFYCRSELKAPWGVALPEMPGVMMFHIVLEGGCWVSSRGEWVWLDKGDSVLIPHGKGHLLKDDKTTPAKPLFDLPRTLKQSWYEELKHGGDGKKAVILCGVVNFDDPETGLLLDGLPAFIAFSKTADSCGGVNATAEMMVQEFQSRRIGNTIVMTRLADILVVQGIRSWLDKNPRKHSWMAARQDPKIGKALNYIHHNLAEKLSLAGLAQQVGMSRAGFANRFKMLVKMAPMAYVTMYRMKTGLFRLKNETGLTVSALVEDLGYESESAFRKAFKRTLGVNVGDIRRNENQWFDLAQVS